MSFAFVDDAARSEGRLWRISPGGSLASGAACLLFAILGLGAGLLAIASPSVPIALVLAAAALAMALFSSLMWREFEGKFGGQILLDATSVTLDLPRGRSLIHKPPAVSARILLEELAAVETRLEYYGSLMQQRAYRLVLRDGRSFLLFEDRAIGTRLATPSLRPVAAEIAGRAGLPLTELPAAEGRQGVLGAWLASPPGWEATMSPERMRKLSGRATWLWLLITFICLLAAASAFAQSGSSAAASFCVAPSPCGLGAAGAGG